MIQLPLLLSAPIRLRPVRAPQLTCRDCPLDKAPLLHPKMKPTGAEQPVFYFMGIAPADTEDEVGEQFVGESGRIIRDRIPAKFQTLIRWNNIIRCKTEGNRDPEPKELACCRRLQVGDIQTTRPKVLVTFGGIPLNWVLGSDKDRKITDWRGRRMPVQIGGHCCWYYPLVHPAAFLHARARDKTEPAMRAFEHDLKRVFTDYTEGLPEPAVEDPKDYHKGVEILLEFGAKGVSRIRERLTHFAQRPDSTIDIETNGLRPYRKDARILSCAVGLFQDAFAFPLEHREHKWKPTELQEIYGLLLKYLLADSRKWAHYAKFEQEWLAWKYGPKALFSVRWHDTGALAHALDERKGKALEDLTLIKFGFNVKLVSPIERSRIDEYELREVLLYNGMDTKYQDGVRILLQEEVEEQGVGRAYAELNRATPSFVMMQRAGVTPNHKAVETLTDQLSGRQKALLTQIDADPDVRKFTTAFGKFKPTSNPDLVKFFRDFLQVPHPNEQARYAGQSRGGVHRRQTRPQQTKYSLAEDILERIAHPIAPLVLELRTAIKNLSTYVEPIGKPLHDDGYLHDDGFIHTTFSNLLTVTGRSSCEDPPLQQFPRREHKEIRAVIGAPPGHLVVSFDFGQLEARIIGMISRDPVLVAEIFAGYDIHGDWTDQLGKEFAPQMLRTAAERKHLRDYVKNKWTFPLFFGSKLESVAYDLSGVFKKEIHPEILAEYYDAFWDKYRGVKRWQEELILFYWKHSYVETLTGFRRREPMTANELINQPIQGTAAHIVIDAQIRLSQHAYDSEQPRFQPRINIHDDLTFYLPKSPTLEQDIEFIGKQMCLPSYAFITVPLSVEVSIGPNLADKEDLVTFSSTDFGWAPARI